MSMDYIEKAISAFDPDDSAGLFEQESAVSDDFEYTKSTIVTVSQEHLKKNRVLTPDMDKSVINAYKILRTRVLQIMEQNGWGALAITSPKPNEGKTLTAINFSISLAQKHDYTVLLADLDFRKPSLHKYFGFEPEWGLNDYLEGRVELEKVFVNPGMKRLLLLPVKEEGNNSSEILSSLKMKRLIAELKTRYASRILIFDLPPVFVGDDVLAFSHLADAVLLVACEALTTKDELERSVELLKSVNLLGTVLNRSSIKEESSAYAYY